MPGSATLLCIRLLCLQHVLGGTPLHKHHFSIDSDGAKVRTLRCGGTMRCSCLCTYTPKASVKRGRSNPARYVQCARGVAILCTESQTGLRVTMQDQEADGVPVQVLGQALEGATGGAADAHVAVEAQAEGATGARWASEHAPAHLTTFQPGGIIQD